MRTLLAVKNLNVSSGTQFDTRVVNSFLPLARAEMSSVFAAAGTAVTAIL
jgi:hypothetical protein